ALIIWSSPYGLGSARTTRGSLHVLSAVDRDVRARHERRLFGSEVDHEARDFLRLAEPADRYLRQDLRVQHVLWDRGDHLRADVARRDRVDRDALLRDFERQR